MYTYFYAYISISISTSLYIFPTMGLHAHHEICPNATSFICLLPFQVCYSPSPKVRSRPPFIFNIFIYLSDAPLCRQSPDSAQRPRHTEASLSWTATPPGHPACPHQCPLEPTLWFLTSLDTVNNFEKWMQAARPFLRKRI